jgi:hypothetical protein
MAMEHTGPVPETTSLPANACLIARADRISGDPTRGWYFAVLVRAATIRHQMLGS